MELFKLEHKKLWRRGSVKICILLCFVYIVVFGSILSYQWFTYGSSNDVTNVFGNNFDGYSMIRKRQEYSLEFGGKLTEETLQQLVGDYQRLEAVGTKDELEKADRVIIEYWLRTLWPELSGADSYQMMMSYVDTNKLTGFYARRQQVIETFLDNDDRTEEEKEYLLQMEQRVEKPFRYEWAEGWLQILRSIVSDIGLVMALFLAIVLSTMFAGEWYLQWNSLLF